MDHPHPQSGAVLNSVRTRLAAQAAVIRVWLLSAALASAAAVGYFAFVRGMATLPAPVTVPWPVLAVAFASPRRRSSTSTSDARATPSR